MIAQELCNSFHGADLEDRLAIVGTDSTASKTIAPYRPADQNEEYRKYHDFPGFNTSTPTIWITNLPKFW